MYPRHWEQSLAYNMYSLIMLISVHTNTLLVRRKHEQKVYFYGGKKKYKNTSWPQVCSMPGCEQNVLGTNQSLDSYQSHSYYQEWCNQPPCGPHWGQRAPGWESPKCLGYTCCDGLIMREIISICDQINGQRTPETQTLQNKHFCLIIDLNGTCGPILGHNNINQSIIWPLKNH